MSDLELRKPESLYLIGIDQSYTGFGLVVLDGIGSVHQKRLLKYPLNKYKDEGDRLYGIYNDLIEIFTAYKTDETTVHIGMEGYAYGAKLNREKLGELGGIVKLASRTVFGISPEVIAPTALKQFITGSGKADKQAMLAAIQRFDSEIKDHNVADAMALALMLYSS